MKKQLKLEIGTQFGSWKVISETIKKKNNVTHWNCKCSCGIVKYVPLNNLMNGSSKQCKNCSLKLKAENKRKGVGLISGNHWAKIKLRLKREYPNLVFRIEDAWEQFQKQNGLCYLSGRKLSLSGYPYNKSLINAEYHIDNGIGYWLHKDIAKITKIVSTKDLINISKEILVWQNNN
jgi:hypothetical protein